jgi:hypothetical protein
MDTVWGCLKAFQGHLTKNHQKPSKTVFRKEKSGHEIGPLRVDEKNARWQDRV